MECAPKPIDGKTGVFRVDCRRDKFYLYSADRGRYLELVYSDIPYVIAALEMAEQYAARERDHALFAAVRAYREKHPGHGRPAIAAALTNDLDLPVDLRTIPVATLVKRIERLEKAALDK